MPSHGNRTRNGARLEEVAARHLIGLGWTVLARNVRVGRSELDIIATPPKAPATVVVVEVRGRATSGFGAAAESVGRPKVRALYRAVGELRRAGRLPDGTPVPHVLWRVDLVTIDAAPSVGEGMGGRVIEHLEGVEPPGGW